MRTIAQLISWLTLLLGIVLPPVLFFVDRMTLDRVKLVMLIATVVWFVVTPLWMGRKPATQEPAAQ